MHLLPDILPAPPLEKQFTIKSKKKKKKKLPSVQKPVQIQKKYQFVIFNPLSYCFKEIICFDLKASFVNRLVSRLIRWYNKTRWYNNRILRKGYSVSRDFSWIENYKLIYLRQRLLRFLLLPFSRFLDTERICNVCWVAKLG